MKYTMNVYLDGRLIDIYSAPRKQLLEWAVTMREDGLVCHIEVLSLD